MSGRRVTPGLSVGMRAEIGLEGMSSRERFRRGGPNSGRFRSDQGEKRSERHLNKQIGTLLPTDNIFYAIKISGTFDNIKVRSLPKQEKPLHPLLILQTAPWPAKLCLSNLPTQRRFDLRFEAIISPWHRKARGGSHGVNRLLIECRTE
jgi:hypothetical protein